MLNNDMQDRKNQIDYVIAVSPLSTSSSNAPAHSATSVNNSSISSVTQGFHDGTTAVPRTSNFYITFNFSTFIFF